MVCSRLSLEKLGHALLLRSTEADHCPHKGEIVTLLHRRKKMIAELKQYYSKKGISPRKFPLSSFTRLPKRLRNLY